MEGVKTKTKKTVKKTSSVKKKITPTELSNEELLEQILSKKKKQSVVSKTTKVDVSKLSNDELFDYIMSKKKKKKTLTQKSSSTKKASVQKAIEKDFKTNIDKTVENKDLVKKVQDELKKEEIIHFEEKKNKHVFRKIVLATLCLLIISFIVFITRYTLQSKNESYSISDMINVKSKKEIEAEKAAAFSSCLEKEYDESEESTNILQKKKEIDDYVQSYNLSVFYEDLTYGYSYSYQPDDIYYAASTIKVLDALYIYTKAAAGEINLDDTMTYYSYYRQGSSSEMDKHSFGSKITLRDLVKYTITVSDNTAHKMLVSYIGWNTLHNFGEELGASNTINSWDYFGNIDAHAGIVYMKAVYDFVQNNDELGEELKSYFVSSDDNNLKFEDRGIEALTKYGNYDMYYHNIGVVDAYHPYALTVLTKVGQVKGKEVMSNISSMIYDLHDLYYSNRQSACLLEIYG